MAVPCVPEARGTAGRLARSFLRRLRRHPRQEKFLQSYLTGTKYEAPCPLLRRSRAVPLAHRRTIPTAPGRSPALAACSCKRKRSWWAKTLEKKSRITIPLLRPVTAQGFSEGEGGRLPGEGGWRGPAGYRGAAPSGTVQMGCQCRELPPRHGGTGLW